jgi:hypothetical protein
MNAMIVIFGTYPPRVSVATSGLLVLQLHLEIAQSCHIGRARGGAELGGGQPDIACPVLAVMPLRSLGPQNKVCCCAPAVACQIYF